MDYCYTSWGQFDDYISNSSQTVVKDEKESTAEEFISLEVKNELTGTSAMETSDADTSKDNSLSVSLFVHTDGIQDDLDEELIAAAKAEEDAEAKKEQEKKGW